MKDSGKNDANISAYWSNAKDNQGIILATTVDGKNKRFFIDASTMPESNVEEALRFFGLAEEYKKNNQPREARKAIATALTKLHTGLTIHQKGFDYNQVRQLSLKESGLTGGIPSSTEGE